MKKYYISRDLLNIFQTLEYNPVGHDIGGFYVLGWAVEDYLVWEYGGKNYGIKVNINQYYEQS